MKKLSLTFIIILLLGNITFASPGDKVADKYNAAWQIAASGLTTLLSKMDGLPDAYMATQSMDEWATWMRLEYGQSTSLNKIFPVAVYSFLISRLVGYNYGDTEIHDDYKPPTNPAVDGSDITCDEDPTGAARTVLLYKWDYVKFEESSISGSLSAGTWTFSSVSSGSYVLAYSGFDALPTIYLTIP